MGVFLKFLSWNTSFEEPWRILQSQRTNVFYRLRN